ncbi:MAG: TIGR01212 family radical SAM protein [Proteobacteria bacterium]|nr:TIGR01212 family radical SAM protein [Pseudomonadota bacterium]
MPSQPQPFRDLNGFFRETFGCRVHKIALDAGLSCPNRDGTLSHGGCAYCNARGSGTGAAAAGLSIAQQAARAKTYLARRFKAKKFIAYFQSYTNTHAPLETLARLWNEALAGPDVVGISIGTRPDCVPDPVLDLLAKTAAGRMAWLELGLQSANDATLSRINRGHTAACWTDAASRAQSRGLLVCAHVILGLPGENRQDMRRTAEFVAASGVEGVKIHLLYVVRGTEMERMHQAGEFQCLEQEEYADAVCDFLERLPQKTVIQRLTGDPHPSELVAPAWCQDKAGALAAIRARLAEKNTWQGKRYPGESRPPGDF